MENSEGTKELSQKEYVQKRHQEADNMYEKVVKLAKSNGCVYIDWVQRNFQTDYYGASHIIDKMIEEGICGEFDSTLGARKIIAS